MVLGSLIPRFFIFSTGLAQPETLSSRCPATSVASVPGCWGTPACAYVLAGSGGMCEFDYCNCGGVAAPLLPTVISGTSTVGCNYPTQPAFFNCPSGTEPSQASPIPTESGSPGRLTSDALVVTETLDGGSTVTRTFVPTTYSEFAMLTITSTIVTTQTEVVSTFTDNGQTSTTLVPLLTPVTSTITVGPSGVAWVPFNTIPGAPPLPAPTALPDVAPTVVSSSVNGNPPHASSSNSPILSATTNGGVQLPSSSKSVFSSVENHTTSGGAPLASSINSEITDTINSTFVSATTNGGPSVPSLAISSNSLFSSIANLTLVSSRTSKGPSPVPSTNSVLSSTEILSVVSSSTNGGPSLASSSTSVLTSTDSSTVVSSSTSGGPPLASSSNSVFSSTDILSVLSSTTNGGPSPAFSSNSALSSAENMVPTFPSDPGPTSSDDVLPPVITLFDISLLTIASVDPSITENTAISTSDGNHPAGLYPFIRGGPNCFFCPPGVNNGGFVLWGMNRPGIYPPPVPPPVPNVPWPTITIGPGNKPTPGANPENENPEEDDPQESTTSEGCTTTTASSCAVSCTTPSGQSTLSCTTTKCETTSGCSVTNIASTTTKSGSCSPTNWVQDGVEDIAGRDAGEEGPDPSYAGSVPAWVTAWPSETGAVGSKTSNEGVSTTTPPPMTDGNGNIRNITKSGTIYGCKSTSISVFAWLSITKCLSSSSIGMDITPTSTRPEPTCIYLPEPTGSREDCDACEHKMSGSNCFSLNFDCLEKQCERVEACAACGRDCFMYARRHQGKCDLRRRRDAAPSARSTISPRLIQMSNKLSRRKEVEPTPLGRITGLNRPRSLSPAPAETPAALAAVLHSPAWKKYAPKGVRIFKTLQSNGMVDKVEPTICELDAYFTLTGSVNPTLARAKGALFEQMGVTPTKSYLAVSARGPKEGMSKNGENEDAATFLETISAEQGVFFANENDRGEKRENGVVTEKPTPYQMSTVAWWLWKHVVMKSQDPSIAEKDTDFSKFRYFVRVNIVNKETIEILKAPVLGDITTPKSFTPEDESHDNPFWPLLGSPNGNGIGWFLADHKGSLKGKTIERITAWLSDEDEYHFWATIK